ncbi:unnamed protein product [Microthlaspi erraticum]|uniref:Transposase-associated domain-containing protein n=1 Tax=Microthlaspi erraticum TaxID=1685480 RepID=A0A6D2HSP7_9BRAS|nr:unnamed protein product [Microthlaspi erraticum]
MSVREAKPVELSCVILSIAQLILNYVPGKTRRRHHRIDYLHLRPQFLLSSKLNLNLRFSLTGSPSEYLDTSALLQRCLLKMLDKEWVNLSRADPGYEIGAWIFVNSVGVSSGDTNMVVCPCIDCRNLDRHLGCDVVDHLWNEEIVGLFKAAGYLDEELASKGDLGDFVEGEDKKEDEFLAKLEDAVTPLYPSCVSHSKLSAIVSLFRIKTQNGWSDKSFNDLLEELPKMLPENNVLHTSMYDVKKFLRSFDMGYQKIHPCVNDCCLFRKRFEKLDSCPKCNASRWKINMRTGKVKKGVPQKVLRYFPIIPRLKRMFRSEETAKNLLWHSTNKSKDGKLRHPVDSVTWDQVDAKYPSFAAEQRNIRLGLSTDGFNPFSMKSSRYSCWPVLLVNYNMAPDMCMKKENIMLSLLIPGPRQPGNSIDI